jgi:hypothetical protein
MTGRFFFNQRKLINKTDRSQGPVQKGHPPRGLYINYCGIPIPVSCSINFFSSMTPANTEEDPNDHEPVNEKTSK